MSGAGTATLSNQNLLSPDVCLESGGRPDHCLRSPLATDTSGSRLEPSGVSGGLQSVSFTTINVRTTQESILKDSWDLYKW